MNGSHYLCDTVYNHHSKWKREYDTHHKHFFFWGGGVADTAQFWQALTYALYVR